MARRRAKRQSGDMSVPVESFSDIAFLLIIFFILVTSLTQIAGMVTDIPTGKKAETKTDKTNIISIHNGVITVNDVEVNVAGMRKKLEGMRLHKKKGDQKVVMLEATGKVSYQMYYEVMTSITAAGGIIAIVQEDTGGET